MITVELKQFCLDHSIFGFYWIKGAHRGSGSKGFGKYGIYTWHKRWSYKFAWRWNWHPDLEADWNCTVWHRCYKRHARTSRDVT